MKTGRNDPCPCGSGKKYKQCCLQTQTAELSDPIELSYRRLSRELKEFTKKLINFTVDQSNIDPEQPWAEFCAERLVFEELGLEVVGEVFMAWLCYHRVDPLRQQAEIDAVPGARSYLSQHAKRLSPVLREYLQTGLETPFSYHQVQSVDRGRSVQLLNLISGQVVKVRDKSVSSAVPVGAICFVKVVQLQDFALLDGMFGHVIPAMLKPKIIDLREALKAEGHDAHEQARPDTTKRLLDHLDNLVATTLPGLAPKLHNHHGEAIEPHVLRYQIDSAQACVDALLGFGSGDDTMEADVQHDADGELHSARLHWVENSDATLLAMFDIAPNTLRVEVNSRERAERVQALISTHLGDQARPGLTEISGADSMFEPAESVNQPEIEELNQRPEVQALLEQHLAKHYETWPDIPLPALGDITPMDAVKTAVGREKVQALLEAFQGGGKPVPEGVMHRLRERLGLR